MSSKIKDGLFMGDVDAAQDAEFLQLNGIVHIVNCVPRQVPNLFQQSLGLSYTACDLDDVLRRPLFDLKNREFMAFVQLIDRALEKTESVLVHSLHGANRSPSLMIGYLMVKYCWGVDKAYDFVSTKRSDIKLDESYAEQLCALEMQLQKAHPTRATEQQLYEWHAASVDTKTDELVLVHTYLNATAKASAASSGDHARKRPTARAHRRLSWIDQCAHLVRLAVSHALACPKWSMCVVLTLRVCCTGPRCVRQAEEAPSIAHDQARAATEPLVQRDVPGSLSLSLVAACSLAVPTCTDGRTLS